MVKVGRRNFIQLAWLAIIAMMVFVWDKLTLNHLDLEKQKKRIFPFNKNKTVAFAGNYIIINQDEKTKVLSSHCTHLGCTINQTENNRLVCPCHGSEYDLNGNVLKGPAYRSLETIPSKIIADGTKIEIEG